MTNAQHARRRFIFWMLAPATALLAGLTIFPFLAGVTMSLTNFRAIDAFKTFDIIFVLTGGGPGTSTRTLNLLAYKQGLEFLNMAYAATIAIVMLVLTIAAAQFFLRRMDLFQPKANL